MKRLVPAIATVTFAASAALAVQDFPGDPMAGQDFAQRTCIACHQEQPGGLGEPAASFQEIANAPGMTGTALLAWLTSTPHPTMPNLILAPDEARDVVAYILSLKEGGARPQ